MLWKKFEVKMASPSSPTKDATKAVQVKLEMNSLGYLLHM